MVNFLPMVSSHWISAHISVADNSRNALLQVDVNRKGFEEMKGIHDKVHPDLWRQRVAVWFPVRVVRKQPRGVLCREDIRQCFDGWVSFIATDQLFAVNGILDGSVKDGQWVIGTRVIHFVSIWLRVAFSTFPTV